MAWTSGFHNSINGDRLYNARQMSEIFEGLITNGVYEKVGNKLAVEPNSGMTIQINTGRGWFGGSWVQNDSPLTFLIDNSDVTLNRYCAVVIKSDRDGARTAEPYLKYSEFATNPVKPTMERTEAIKEYCLAYIYIKAGATTITASDIEDTRGDTELCGWVTGLIEQVDTTTLWNQYKSIFNDFMIHNEAEFLEWFNSLVDYIDSDVETKLVADVKELQGRVIKSTGVFDGLGWSREAEGVYTQTITVNGVTADNDIMISPSLEHKADYIAMGCVPISQGENSITFSCTDPDDINMIVDVIIFTFQA